MKGRPITREEFERMLTKVRKVLRTELPSLSEDDLTDRVKTWRHYLIGLYLSGLRLFESLQLTWDDSRSMRVASLDPRKPSIAIRAETDKGNVERLFPITPDFAAFLRKIPTANRRGFVFRPTLTKHRAQVGRAGRIITAIGRAAPVVVHVAADGKQKCASAHDLRRAFGTRLAMKIRKPVILQQYMRHKAIQTTMKYYVNLDLDDMTNEVYEAFREAKRDLSRDPADVSRGKKGT